MISGTDITYTQKESIDLNDIIAHTFSLIEMFDIKYSQSKIWRL